MYLEEDLLPISALQHLLFCPRQCALIHIERLWEENWLTAKGQVLHCRVDQEEDELRHGIDTATSLPLHSFRLGLVGKADLVEFHEDNQPYPVEYKRGKPKIKDWDRVQLCAQALCLEEMLNTKIRKGALFYQSIMRRESIDFDTKLRNQTEKTAENLHHLIKIGKTPLPKEIKKCKACSLQDFCLPKIIGKKQARHYIQMLLEEL